MIDTLYWILLIVLAILVLLMTWKTLKREKLSDRIAAFQVAIAVKEGQRKTEMFRWTIVAAFVLMMAAILAGIFKGSPGIFVSGLTAVIGVAKAIAVGGNYGEHRENTKVAKLSQ